MNSREKINTFFGVWPPDPLKRITISLISVIVVLVVDVLMLLGHSIGMAQYLPFLSDRVVSVIVISSVLFALSLIYYVVLPGSKSSGKSEAYV